MAHRSHWPVWAREWIGHQVDRWVARRIRNQRAGWFSEDWLLRQHRRRFGMAAFIRSDYGLERPQDPAVHLPAFDARGATSADADVRANATA